MADFLLELLGEEIPARMQKGARAELERLLRRELDAAGVGADTITVWSTPRRLALIARGLPLETEAVREEAKGPPVGAPDQAVDGFCRKNGVTRDQLEERQVKGRATYFAVIERPGQAVSDLLAAAIPAIIRDFSWPKSMRWGEASISTESLKWVRPLTGIVALLDGELVPVVMEGIASGRETMGHRFHSSGPVTIRDADDYANALEAAHVIVDHEKREGLIRDGARRAAQAAGLTLVEDEGLVVENAGLTEWPVPLLGRFDEEFLEVPPEVIQLTARVNQKYFVCTRAPAKAGASGDGAQPKEVPAFAGTHTLANAFICTANIVASDPAVVVDGNRKVLAARLADARFFWELDQKTSLEEHAKKLERITFHEKLGTVADKVERVAKLARWLCEEGIVGPERVPAKAGTSIDEAQDAGRSQPSLGLTREELADLAEQAARLCKADLVTEMVGEFPELQGLMGGYYAEKEGLPQEVSDAIRDHYKPVGQGDEVPTAPVTVAVSLADKLDSLFAFFAISERPSGSKDPFALRRSALSALRLIVENNLRFSFIESMMFGIPPIGGSIARAISKTQVTEIESFFASEAIRLTDAELTFPKGSLDWEGNEFLADLKASVLASPQLLADFMTDRLKVQQREAGVRHDLIDAVFALGGEDDLVRLLARVKALQSFIETDNGANLLAGYKRAANILKKEGYDTPLPVGEGSGVGGAAPARSNTHPQPLPLREGASDDPLEQTGEEDPLALAGKPDFDDALRAAQSPPGTGLSYTPEPSEKALIDALDAAEPKAAAAIEAEDFEGAMAALASLREPIDRFFDNVIVNAPEADKRNARLALLARFRNAVHRVADFSRIEG
ncbi:MAG: glycine--tRNA ligase subunit beta [Erythrobacter sp.]|uniref:glycine--tRNA ligase subunit beta n=1 Tax=Erythrobacter sp. TaxID=1042 RepID=UPI00262C1666|nr:glycine--tRNA ligase subunit beta [Erythrobacter sp.]MDJ0977678.1 glycine--tRNA ligase subunit beta [Erythrobacter sp.]